LPAQLNFKEQQRVFNRGARILFFPHPEITSRQDYRGSFTAEATKPEVRGRLLTSDRRPLSLLSGTDTYDYECGIFSKRLKNFTRSCGGKSLV
jgi:hypothetical protein